MRAITASLRKGICLANPPRHFARFVRVETYDIFVSLHKPITSPIPKSTPHADLFLSFLLSILKTNTMAAAATTPRVRYAQYADETVNVSEPSSKAPMELELAVHDTDLTRVRQVRFASTCPKRQDGSL